MARRSDRYIHVLPYIKDGMSANKGNLRNKIPNFEENFTTSYTGKSKNGAIYSYVRSLIKHGYIEEIKGRWYRTGKKPPIFEEYV